ncbi:MAG TPA: dienelactone hydrolase family protein [Alphaproteobacteria bacterium]|jgi:carboxymethylenebutenolidase
MIETLTTTVPSKTGGDSTMSVYLARPKGFAGPRPAVLVLHHKGGVDDFTRDRVTRLAEAGYLAAAPDFFHRTAGGDPDGHGKAMLDTQIIADAVAALETVKAATPVREEACATLGHCMGGRMSFLIASAHPVFAAAVVYYGGYMFGSRGEGPTPFDRLSGLRCPVAGFFGNDDTNPSPDDVERIDAELTRLGVRHTFHRYDGAAHAFQNFLNPVSHREAQARDAWGKTLSFLAAELKP